MSFAPLELFAGRNLDDPVTLRDVATALPGRRPGKRLGYETVLRWATRGRRGRRLQTVLVGGLRVTTWRKVAAFLDEGSRDLSKPEPTAPSIGMQAAGRLLDELGL